MSSLINGIYYPKPQHKIIRNSAYKKILEKRFGWIVDDIEDEETKFEISVELDIAYKSMMECSKIPKRWIEELTNIKEERILETE